MYHGGSTPVLDGKYERGTSGLPKISYDLGTHWRIWTVRDSYFDLVPLHLFIKNFGSLLAAYNVTLPATNPSVPSDTDTLRYAVRSNGHSGFVFINNYKDHAQMKGSIFRPDIKTAGSFPGKKPLPSNSKMSVLALVNGRYFLLISESGSKLK